MARASDRAVAVTGLGAVSPFGLGCDALWSGLLAGRSAAAQITAFDASQFGVRFACEAPQDLAEWLPRRLVRQTDRFSHMALLAAAEALGQAGFIDQADSNADSSAELRQPVTDVDPERIGVIIGSGVGGLNEITEQHLRLLDGGPGRVRPYFSIAMPINMAAGQIAIRHGLLGPAAGVVSACASGADAIGSGLDLIRSGRVDVVVVGGSEASINPVAIAGFDAAQAMSRRNDDPEAASRPFDTDRDGFVVGEGAGCLVLERSEHARARGVTVLAELSGYGATNDAHDPTKPAPGGSGAARAMRLALADAGLAAEDVSHVNAHGTSTTLNDIAEATAVADVLPHGPPVTSVKSSIGHLLGAAGAVEAVTVVQTLLEQVIPPTINLTRQDPACHIHVITEPTAATVNAVVTNSFGFGGHNAALVFARA